MPINLTHADQVEVVTPPQTMCQHCRGDLATGNWQMANGCVGNQCDAIENYESRSSTDQSVTVPDSLTFWPGISRQGEGGMKGTREAERGGFTRYF